MLQGHAECQTDLQEHALIEKHGVCIKVLGDLSLVPLTVRAAADRVMEATAHHARGRLNICLSYGSASSPYAALPLCLILSVVLHWGSGHSGYVGLRCLLCSSLLSAGFFVWHRKKGA